MPWSDDARVMVHPFRTYTELRVLRSAPSSLRFAFGRALFFLFIVAAFVSMTAAGRLVAFHIASSMFAWAFLPLIQAGLFALAARFLDPDRDSPSLSRAIGLYFTGHGPWMLFFMALVGVCLFSPNVYDTMTFLLRRGILPLGMLLTILWSIVLTFACFRAGLAFSRARAFAATGVFYVGFVTIILGWYLALNQIQPQVPFLHGF